MHATPSVNRFAHLWLARVATSLRREALGNIVAKIIFERTMKRVSERLPLEGRLLRSGW